VAIGGQQFKEVLRLWASGVSVVTTPVLGGMRAITVSSVTSLSLDPPLVLICIEKKAHAHAAIARARCFAINILRDDQAALSDQAAGRHRRRAARRGPARARRRALQGARHSRMVTGAPVLEDSLAWLDCRLAGRHDGGDHTIFVGRVEAAGASRGQPLLWFDRDYARVSRRARRAPVRRSRG
jgi:flavin reductase (DIM6/NTAB) family NADH-FMN oxidoreductase RutF